VGAASGIVFWGATRLFVIVADRWALFRKAVAAAYGEASDTPLARELLLSLLLAVPGEELFWRGFTQESLAPAGGGAGGAPLVGRALYLVATLPSRSLPIITAALVAGFLWG